jgi:hypothetical protein
MHGGDSGGGHGGGSGGHHGGAGAGHHHHRDGAELFIPVDSPGPSEPRRRGQRAFFIFCLTVVFFSVLVPLTIRALSH